MSRRRSNHRHQIAFEPSAEARLWLREDLPEQVLTMIRLAQKGGRLPRGCLVCGRAGLRREVFIPDQARTLAPGKARATLYVLCDAHQETPDAEVGRLLQKGKR